MGFEDQHDPYEEMWEQCEKLRKRAEQAEQQKEKLQFLLDGATRDWDAAVEKRLEAERDRDELRTMLLNIYNGLNPYPNSEGGKRITELFVACLRCDRETFDRLIGGGT